MDNEVKTIDFGKYVYSNFVIEKVKEEYTDELKEKLSGQGITGYVKEMAEKEGYVPYIIFRDVAGIVEAKYIFGCDMYMFFDTLEVENGEFTEECKKVLDIYLAVHYLQLTLVGDPVYLSDTIKTQNCYIERITSEKKD